MSRWIGSLLLLCTFLSGAEGGFELTHRFTLKKDQPAVIEIRKDTPVTYAKEGLLTFRWTLWQNRRLVLLLDYEGFKHQYILETKFGRNTTELFLTGDYKRIDRRPFLLLTFEKFSKKERRATITAQLHDPDKRLEIKIKKPMK